MKTRAMDRLPLRWTDEEIATSEVFTPPSAAKIALYARKRVERQEAEKAREATNWSKMVRAVKREHFGVQPVNAAASDSAEHARWIYLRVARQRALVAGRAARYGVTGGQLQAMRWALDGIGEA